MLILSTPAEAEKFVRRQKRLITEQGSNDDIRWDNYDVVFFREAPQGIYSRHGAFKNGVWGFENRVPVNEEGKWEIDWRNVRKSTRRTRN